MVDDGTVVRVHYVGRVKDSGDVFDLTDPEADAADEVGEEVDLGPVDVLVGAGHVIPGLEDALREMAPGDERTVTVNPEDGFGERESDAVETFSRREFDDHGVEPRRGVVVEVDGRRGKIVSASSGRVRVDFNHPMAGKTLEYDVEVLSAVDDPVDAVRAVLDYYGLEEADVSVEDGEATVQLPDGVTDAAVDRVREELERVAVLDDVTVDA